nr:hypothetical protein [Tanacetum cinerariifolium]
MASKQSSLGPALNEMTPATISSGLMPKPSSSTPYVPPLRNDWDLLFQSLFDELLTPPSSVDPPTPEVIALIANVIPPVQAESTGNDPLFGVPIPKVTSDQSLSTSSLGPALNEMTPATISSGLMPKPSSSTPYVPPLRNDWDLLFQSLFDELLTPPSSVDPPTPEVIALIANVIPPVQAESTGNDPLFGVPIPKVTSDQSLSTVSPHIILQPDHQIPQHNSKWTKDHSLDNIICQLS